MGCQCIEALNLAALARQAIPKVDNALTSKTASTCFALSKERMKSRTRPCPQAFSPQADLRWLSQNRNESGRLCPTPPKQYLTLSCRATGETDVVMATYCPVITTGLIARRIVRRLCLDSRSTSTAPEQVTWGCTSLSTTKQFVDLACAVGPVNEPDVYRFYVVKSCPFDIILGPRMNTLRAT